MVAFENLQQPARTLECLAPFVLTVSLFHSLALVVEPPYKKPTL